MPTVNRKLTHGERQRVGWAMGYRSPRRNDFLREIMITGTTVVNIGPRGGRTWGRAQLDSRSFERIRTRLFSWYRVVFIVDEHTRKVHIRVREREDATP